MLGTRFRRLLVWFRRDLRLHDNEALFHAVAEAERVVPVFVLSDAILRRPDMGTRRVQFLCESLADLDANLRARGAGLVIRRGDAVETIVALVRESGAEAVYFQADTEPYGRERDLRAVTALASIGVSTQEFSGATVVPPDRVLSQAGSPYVVYTPYARAWQAEPIGEPLPAPARIASVTLPSLPLPAPADLGIKVVGASPRGGEDAGRERLATFIARGLAAYAEQRDFPGVDGTSRLSAHLTCGTVSAREVLWRVRLAAASCGPEMTASAIRFAGELAWRDFYTQILCHHPRVEKESFDTRYEALIWEDDPVLIDAWRLGRTGYPIVDAAMRQLCQEGWMHNRTRMIAASFLTKDLLVDWRIGERHFMQQLVDGDLASNNGGWQWAASTGTDAQPFFRVFNPVAQGRRFDPTGDYVRRYVPELRSIPDRFIHSPWEMPVVLQQDLGVVVAKDYAAPIVHHNERRLRAIATYRAARKRSR
jgi:deoxyribodipyrimidine photo-lyase